MDVVVPVPADCKCLGHSLASNRLITKLAPCAEADSCYSPAVKVDCEYFLLVSLSEGKSKTHVFENIEIQDYPGLGTRHQVVTQNGSLNSEIHAMLMFSVGVVWRGVVVYFFTVLIILDTNRVLPQPISPHTLEWTCPDQDPGAYKRHASTLVQSGLYLGGISNIYLILVAK